MKHPILAALVAGLFAVNSVWACPGGSVELDISKFGFPTKTLHVTGYGIDIESRGGQRRTSLTYNRSTRGVDFQDYVKSGNEFKKAGPAKDSLKYLPQSGKNAHVIPLRVASNDPKKAAGEPFAEIEIGEHKTSDDKVERPDKSTFAVKNHHNTFHLYDPKSKNPKIRVEIQEIRGNNVTVVTLVKDGKDMKSFEVWGSPVSINEKGEVIAAARSMGGQGKAEFDPAVSKSEGKVTIAGCGGASSESNSGAGSGGSQEAGNL